MNAVYGGYGDTYDYEEWAGFNDADHREYEARLNAEADLAIDELDRIGFGEDVTAAEDGAA